MKRSICSAISLVLLSSLVTAQAQEQTPPEETSSAKTEGSKTDGSKADAQKDKKKEVIQVTGSRIKRIDIEGPTQIQTVTKEDMEKGGQTTLSEVLRDIPVSIAGATREESNRGAPGFSGVNLRGIGEKYTLVLIDGHRLPPDPTFDSVDVGAIPTAMIERVEILKEGAGAIYGSDAVGGVVNIVTKKAFDGSSVLLSYSKPSGEGGVETRFEAVTGKTFDNGSVILTGTYRSRDLILAKDRDFIGEGWSSSGAPGSFVPIAINGDGEYEQKGDLVFAPDPNCPTNNGTSRVFDTGAGGVVCQFNYESVRAISPKLTDIAVMAKVDYSFSDKLSAYALLKAGKRESQDLIAPAPTDGPIDIIDAQAVANIKAALGAAGSEIDTAAGDGVRIRYRTVPLGLRDTRTNDTSNLLIAGLKGQLTETWDWDLSYSYGQILREEIGANGFWKGDVLPDIIASGAFNPFDPSDDGSALQAAEYEFKGTQGTQTRQSTMTFSGPVADLPGGPIQVAVGASYVSEDFTAKDDPEVLSGNVQGGSSSAGSGHRKTTAFFAEAAIPVVKDMEINAAARFDHYEKYGNNFSPRLAMKYKTGDVLWRASVGTGFRAPTLQEESANGGTGYPAFVDQVACTSAKADGDPDGITYYCSEQQYEYTEVATEEDVKPEKVFIYSAGAVYAPTPAVSISSDFWAASIKDRIGVPDLSQLTQLELDGNTSYLEKGITIQRYDFGEIEKITAPATNLARTDLAGIDVAANLNLGSRKLATFEYALDGSYQLYSKVAAFEGSPMVDTAGTARSPKYRMNNTFGTTFLSDNNLSVVHRRTAGTEKVNPDLGDIPAFNTYDLHYTYSALFNGSLSVGAINFANLNPPKDESANPTINFDLYSYTGRSFYVRLTQNF